MAGAVGLWVIVYFCVTLVNTKDYGVTGVSFELIISYQTHRKQYVKFQTLELDYMAVKSVVTHGSILGPLLLSIYINDLVTVSKTFKFLMYVDDTLTLKIYLVLMWNKMCQMN